MNKSFVFIILLFLPFLMQAQEQDIDKNSCRMIFPGISLNKEKTDSEAVACILKFVSYLSAPGVSVQQTARIESPGGLHLTWQEFFNNCPVYRSEVKLNLARNGRVLSLLDNSYPALLPDSLAGTPFPGMQRAKSYADRNFTGQVSFSAENTFFPHEGYLIPALRAVFKGNDHILYREVIFNNRGEVLYTQDMNRYCRPASTDSSVSATVFMPDPLTGAQVTYGIPYKDYNDSDLVLLNNQRTTVSMNTDFTNDTFRLASPYVLITELSDPVTAAAFSTLPVFDFTRSQNGFEDVNAFYHLNERQKHIQSLGFNNLVNYQIQVDPHGINGADQSFFSLSTSPPNIQMGEGGVDDAEDADVLMHEYTHAVLESAAPGSGNGMERRNIDEGCGDYFAASYSRYLNSYKWENVFSWDGHNEFWPGRSAVSGKHYPGNLTGMLYEDADIWSSTLMEIWSDLGRDNTDKILYQSMYSYSSNMTMAQAAVLFIQADSLLNAGVNYPPVCYHFNARGFISTSCPMGIQEYRKNKDIEMLNSAGFANRSGKLIVKAAGKEKITKACIFSIAGKKISEHTQGSSSDAIEITNNTPCPGFYILKIQTTSGTYAEKLISF